MFWNPDVEILRGVLGVLFVIIVGIIIEGFRKPEDDDSEEDFKMM